MATALDLDEGDRREPVIASSNRAADIEPYARGLFAEDPKKWTQILPWEFPNGEQQVEEQFLRQVFTDREIRKQGGASAPGNGYRFLKQVWVWAAMWNANQRIPMITWDWMEKNQDLVNDPNMLPHLLSKEVKPSTFFTPEEIDMYSEKVLVYAVNGIQAWIQQRANETAARAPESGGQDTAEGADATSVPDEQDTTGQTEVPPEQLVAAITNDTAATTKPDEPAPVAIAPAGTRDPAVVQVTTAHAQGNQIRNFASDSNLIEDRHSSWRRGRGNQGKRNSFDQLRPAPRAPPTFGDPRHVSNPYPSSYGGQPVQMSPMPPGSAPVTHRFPSGSYPSPMAPMPTLPQGQQLYAPAPPPGYPAPMQQPYGPPMSQQHINLNTTAPAAGSYQYGPVSNVYMQGQPPPFADRSNVHPNTRHFSNEQPYSPMGDQPDHRYGRRDSVQSRGVKGRGGYGGSVRGRGRGRGSLSNESTFMARTGTNDTNTVPFNQYHNIFREGDWHGQQWQSRSQAEGSLAQGNSYTSTEHARTRYPQRSYPGNGPTTYGPNDPRPGTGPHTFYSKNNQPCTAGCTSVMIGDTCRTATKLIVFNVAPSLDMEEGMHFFSGFGRVLHMSEPRQATTADGKPGKHFLFVAFDDVSAARKCMASRGTPWPGGMLLPEVAKEHWSANRYRPAPNYQRLSNASGAPNTTANPAQEMQIALPQQQNSGCSTPVATNSSSTPTPSQGNTPKTKKTSKKKSKKNHVERQQSISNDKSSESEHSQDGGARQDAEKSAEEASPPLEAEDTKKPEADEPIDQDVPPVVEDTNVEVADDPVTKAGEDGDSTPTVPYTGPVVVSEKTESVPDEPAEPDNVAGESVQSIEHHDDDFNEESFHTASGSPEAEKELAFGELDVATTPTPPDQGDSQEEAATASISDVGSVHGSESVLSKSLAMSSSPGKDTKKASFPQEPTPKNVTIAVPAVDTEKAEAYGKDQLGALQVPQQRSTSGNSEPKTPAFVTAPSTPAILDTPQDPRSKKTPKQKGPDQTESFSIFSKPKRKSSKAKDKKPAGKRKNSTLETVDDMEMADQTKETSIASEELETSGTKREEPLTQSAESVEPVMNPVIMVAGVEATGATVTEMQGSKLSPYFDLT